MKKWLNCLKWKNELERLDIILKDLYNKEREIKEGKKGKGFFDWLFS